MNSTPSLRRRDLLRFGVLGVAGLVVVKAAGRAVLGTRTLDPARSGPALQNLSHRQAATVIAAVAPMLGPAAEAARVAGRWDPAGGVDKLLGLLAEDQRTLLGVAITLLEEWTPGFASFSRRDLAEREAWLDRWRTSGLPVHRSAWGFMHAALGSTWAGTPDAWAIMGYPGPCVPGPDHPGRVPGQSVSFAWDEVVP